MDNGTKEIVKVEQNKYVYSEADIVSAIQEGLEDCFGYDLISFLEKQVISQLKRYVNLFRFYNRNCPGCVSSNDECKFSMGTGEAKGCWGKAKKGELFDCPVRVNGTMIFDTANPQKGLQDIDISDKKENPYPIIKIDI